MGGQFYGPIHLRWLVDRISIAAVKKEHIPISGRIGKMGFVGSALP